MLEVMVIEDAAIAEVVLDPVRTRLLAELVRPASATTLAKLVGLPRQKVNYHLRLLEQHGLIELVEAHRKGNCVERVMLGVAKSYLISPLLFAASAPNSASPDRFSAQWLLALGSRLMRDVATLASDATRAGKRLATYGLDSEIRFASAADRAAFVQELTDSVSTLVGKYHTTAETGRVHRLIVAVHPAVPEHGQPDPDPEQGDDQGTNHEDGRRHP
jgi:DNA-binding transcriptional ArsR family regulator